MKRVSVQNLVAASLCVALGLILPYATAHAFALPGTVLLPMHIPILLCGLLCGPWYGAASGVIIPLLSSLLTGMPPVFPMLPIMAVQLLLLGLVSGLLYRTFRWNIVVAVAVSILAGLAGYAGMVQILIMMGNPQLRALSIITAAVQGAPGIAIQLFLIPLLVNVLNKSRKSKPVALNAEPSILATGIEIIQKGEATCVVMKDNIVIHMAEGRGVSPLLRLYENEPIKMQDAIVADKIIGKGAAMILVLGKAKMVYGKIMSQAGRQYLEEHGIIAKYGRCVDMISNQTQSGICPIEQSVLAIDDALEGLESMKKTIAVLMQQPG